MLILVFVLHHPLFFFYKLKVFSSSMIVFVYVFVYIYVFVYFFVLVFYRIVRCWVLNAIHCTRHVPMPSPDIGENNLDFICTSKDPFFYAWNIPHSAVLAQESPLSAGGGGGNAVPILGCRPSWPSC